MTMTRLARHLLTILLIGGIFFSAVAQPINSNKEEAPKPYKILTSGKQVTIRCTRDIKNLMVWTAGGNRIVEQKDVNTSTYTFRVNNNEKLLFVMLKLEDGKVYSEKIGIQ